MIEIILCMMLGLVAGVITGLVPGIHINLVSSILVAIYPVISDKFSLLGCLAFLICMSITHTFVDAIPSMLLGVPDASAVAAALPAHKLVMKGRALDALRLNVAGSLAGMTLFVILSPLLISAMPLLSDLPKMLKLMFLLILPVAVLVSKNIKKTGLNLLCFGLAGILGMVTFEMDMLMPLLTGLFGIPILFGIIKDGSRFPEQRFNTSTKFGTKRLMKRTMFASISSLPSALLPGITTAHSAWLSSIGHMNEKEYVFSAGVINTFDMGVAITLFAVTGITRNGTTIAMQAIGSNASHALPAIIISFMMIAAGACTYLTLYLGLKAVKALQIVDYQMISKSIIVMLSIITFALQGFAGLVVLVTATGLGIFCNSVKARRSSMTGVLVIPIIRIFI